jgi:hypothetical protein
VLKFIFWTLLLANAALFAYGQGYLGSFKTAEREPARMKNQLAVDRIALVSAAQAEAAAATAAVAPVEAPAPAPAPLDNLVACTEIGDFDAALARRFETQIAPLGLAGKQGQISVPVTEITQYVVHIAPQGSREAAERRAAELAARGVTNYYIMPDTALRWGISLGVFKSDAAAQSLRDALVRQGIEGVKITGRGPTVNKVAFQFRGIEAEVRDQLGEIRRRYRGIDIRTCK